MKKISLFVCDKCGAQYKDEPWAKRCENNHKSIVNITKARYIPIGDNKAGYPVAIEVLLDNGEHLTFKR